MLATVVVDVALGLMPGGAVVTVGSPLAVVVEEAWLVVKPVEEPPNRQHAILDDVTELCL